MQFWLRNVTKMIGDYTRFLCNYRTVNGAIPVVADTFFVVLKTFIYDFMRLYTWMFQFATLVKILDKLPGRHGPHGKREQ